MRLVMAMLIGISFFGLTGYVKRKLAIPGAEYSAPLVTSCLVILVMLLGGLARALLWVWWALYIAGFAAFVWVYVVHRERPRWDILGLVVAGAVYALWHFKGTYYTGNDSLSHWALVVKYMLRTNRLPDASAELIFFPSYPVGAGVFIYYLSRTVGRGPGIDMVAQFMLYWFSLMPILGFARKNKPVGLIAGISSMILLIAINYKRYTIQVDALMAYMAIGGTCVAIQCRHRFRDTLVAVMPVALALVYVKSAAIFFSVILAVLVAVIPEDGRGKANHRRVWKRLIFCLLAVVAAFGLWQVHIKLAFPGTDGGTHAVSLDTYYSNVKSKPTDLVSTIGMKMLSRLGTIDTRLLCAALWLVGLVLILAMRRNTRQWMKRLGYLVLYTGGVYFLWYIMLFFMYLYTMTIDEARNLASIQRYETTGYLYAFGVTAMFVVAFLSSGDLEMSPRMRSAFSAGIIAVLIAMMWIPIDTVRAYDILFNKSLDGSRHFSYMIKTRAHNEIPEEQRYLIYCAGTTCCCTDAMP